MRRDPGGDDGDGRRTPDSWSTWSRFAGAAPHRQPCASYGGRRAVFYSGPSGPIPPMSIETIPEHHACFVSAEEAVRLVNSRDCVFIHSVAAAPKLLIEALTRRAHELRGVEIVHIHTEGEAPYVHPEFGEAFHLQSFFVGANVREAVNSGRADFIPIFLSELPELFRKRHMRVDVAMISVSPPDRHGFCSLGTSVDVS